MGALAFASCQLHMPFSHPQKLHPTPTLHHSKTTLSSPLTYSPRGSRSNHPAAPTWGWGSPNTFTPTPQTPKTTQCTPPCPQTPQPVGLAVSSLPPPTPLPASTIPNHLPQPKTPSLPSSLPLQPNLFLSHALIKEMSAFPSKNISRGAP